MKYLIVRWPRLCYMVPCMWRDLSNSQHLFSKIFLSLLTSFVLHGAHMWRDLSRNLYLNSWPTSFVLHGALHVKRLINKCIFKYLLLIRWLTSLVLHGALHVKRFINKCIFKWLAHLVCVTWCTACEEIYQ